MEPIDLTQRQVYIYSVISIALSVLIALVPLFFGLSRQQRKLAVIGFVASIVGGAFLGLLLAIPVAAIFTWLIYRSSTDSLASPPDNTPAA
jgi:lysylphosphatidylglycerol synthetase-like protein (DUF2156 family)